MHEILFSGIRVLILLILVVLFREAANLLEQIRFINPHRILLIYLILCEVIVPKPHDFISEVWQPALLAEIFINIGVAIMLDRWFQYGAFYIYRQIEEESSHL